MVEKVKKKGILNSHISKFLSDLGHTDKIVIADAGLPIPEGIPKIDLALKKGVPNFIDVLDALLEDMIVEKIIVADEIKENNALVHQGIKQQISKIEMEYVSHETFKSLSKDAKVVIRTGEVTPYANCILQSGVCF